MWNLLQQPGRLKIQTIDSFAMTLLRQMPLGADFDAQADLVEDGEELYLAAAERLFNRLYEVDPLATYVADFLAWLGNDQQRASGLLASMLARRDQWLDVVSEVVRTHQDAPEQVSRVLGAGVEILNAKLTTELRSQLIGLLLQIPAEVFRARIVLRKCWLSRLPGKPQPKCALG